MTSAAESTPDSGPATSLLVVENDARIVELMRWFLERRGYDVRSAQSIVEVREQLARRRPDLMLSDIELGRDNGREFLPQLSREGLLPPTLVVSGFLDAVLADELQAVPEVVGVLAKPFEFDRLERQIEAALDAGRLLASAPRPAEFETRRVERQVTGSAASAP